MPDSDRRPADGAPLRVAVLGAGSHSSLNHGTSLRDIAARSPGSLELAGVCDLEASKAATYAREFGFARHYTDVSEMLRAEKLDALVLVTPVAATRRIVGELIPRCLPILMEKPPGERSEDTRELLGLARRHGTPVMVSFNRRFSPALAQARRWIASEPAGGPPRSVRSVVARMLRVSRMDKEFIVGTGIHLVDATLSLLAPAARVESIRWTSGHGGQSCLGTVVDRGGAAAALFIAPDSGADEETYEIVGDGWRAEVDVAACSLAIRERGKTVLEWSAPAGMPDHESNGALDETAAFLEAVRSGTPPWPSLEDALQSMLVCEALRAGRQSRATPLYSPP